MKYALRSCRTFAGACALVVVTVAGIAGLACGGASDGTAQNTGARASDPRNAAADAAGSRQPEPASTAVVIEVPRVAPLGTAAATATATSSSAPQVADVGDGWTQFQGNAARTGATARPPIAKPRILWKAKAGILSWLNTPVIVGASTVVVPSSGSEHNKPDAQDGVFGFDLKTGKQTFFVHFARDANGVAAAGDRVFVTCDDGNLHAIDTTTGKLVWKKRGGGKMYTHPLVTRNAATTLVVVGDGTGALRAFDADTGNELWNVMLSGAVRGGAASDGVAIFAASERGDVVAVTPNGKTVWKIRGTHPPFSGGAPAPLEVYAAPTVVKNMLVVPFARDTYYDTPALVAYDVSTGKERWRAKGGEGQFGNLRSSPVVAGDKLLFSEPYSGDIAAVRVADGALVYRKTIGPCYFPQWASPVIAGTTAYVPRFDGSVYAVQAATGKSLWEIYIGSASSAGRGQAPGAAGCDWDVPGASSIFASLALAGDGTIIAGTSEGFVYAIGR